MNPKKYGGYTAAELREMIAGNGYGLDALTEDDGTCSAVISDLLEALSAPAQATTGESIERMISDFDLDLTALDDAVRTCNYGWRDEVRVRLKTAYESAIAMGHTAEATQAGAVPDAFALETCMCADVNSIRSHTDAEAARILVSRGWVKLIAAPQAPVADAAQAAAPAQQPARASEATAYHFHRFVAGQEMAEDVLIERAQTLEDAIKEAVRCCAKRPMTVLVHAPEWAGTLHGGALANVRASEAEEPVAWVLPDIGTREFSGVTLTRSKSIAEKHGGRPLYYHAPAQHAGALTDTARDAARYRWLRENWHEGKGCWCDPDCAPSNLDAAIDAALQSHSEGEAR